MQEKKYSVLIIGSGGREHALAWKIAQSSLAGQIFCAPGNPGTAQVAMNINIKANDIGKLKQFALENKIDVTIVGPEDPLVNGIVNEFQAAGLKIFGPNKDAAQLEGSKVLAKKFLKEFHIPTADSRTFENTEHCLGYFVGVLEEEYPLVIKVDGLAAGKGVCVCKNKDEALDFLRQIDEGKFKGADSAIIIEKFLRGEEASCIVMVDSKGHVLPLASSQDHKARDNGDQGPNTGGMGAYSPAPVITPEVEKKILSKIIYPTLHYLKTKCCINFSGFLYVGLMIKNGEPSVLEFNVRLGDPETQPILYRMKSDLLKLILAALEGNLDKEEIQWNPNPAVCVVMASEGYPGSCEKGFKIDGINEAEQESEAKIFHAGTSEESGKIFTAGGRVLGVTASAEFFKAAAHKAYFACSRIDCDNLFCRTDIAYRAVEREERRGKVVIGIIASGSGTTADVIMRSYKEGKIEDGVVALLISTKNGAGCLEKAQQNDIKSITIPANKRTNPEVWNQQVQEAVWENGINVLILAGCVKEVYPIDDVDIYNTHPAKTKKHGGRNMYGVAVHRHVLEAIRDEIQREMKDVDDDFFTTITFHHVIAGMDKGPPLLRVDVSIPKDFIRDFMNEKFRRIGIAAKKLQQHVLQYEYAMLPGAVNLAILNWRVKQK